MVYKAIGLMSGSSLDGLDIVFAEFHQQFGRWNYEIKNATCYTYPEQWMKRLRSATSLNAYDYQLLHTEYGHYLGQMVNRFIEENGMQYQVALISSHGHTTFHAPGKRMTAQLGDGAALAAETQLPVVTDLRALDIAFGGQGAPIVPIGEKLLLGDYTYFLNLGGIANISIPSQSNGSIVAFDICAANRVLNMLAEKEGKEYDAGGEMAAAGNVNNALLEKLNQLQYYRDPYPKSLANEFGTETVYPIIENAGLSNKDAIRTYTQHIADQIRNSIDGAANSVQGKLLATGGGAFNTFLIDTLRKQLEPANIEVVIPDDNLVKYKEALIMALIGVLRWRQEYNVFSSVTGAKRDSIGGALWNGQEA